MIETIQIFLSTPTPELAIFWSAVVMLGFVAADKYA